MRGGVSGPQQRARVDGGNRPELNQGGAARSTDNIGALRLIFASAVIVGHAPEVIDGDRHREPLTALFHTVSLGDLAVDGFFLVSGYLITMSWLRTGSLLHYLKRRCLRIYPAFVVSYLLSVFVLGPMVGAKPFHWLPETVYRLVLLQQPKDYPGQLVGLHYPGLNGPMWTIAYEFRCYLLVALLGLIGLVRRRWFVLGATAACLASLIGASFHAVRAPLDAAGSANKLAMLTGDPWPDLRLTAAFLVGSSFFLFRDEVFRLLTWRLALLSAVSAAALLFRDPHFAEPALMTLGAMSLFWVGFRADIGPLQRINSRWDISYGVYLYGWPIATAIRWFDRAISPWTLAVFTLPLALVAGAASWWGVEKWTKDLAPSRSRAASVQGCFGS